MKNIFPDIKSARKNSGHDPRNIRGLNSRYPSSNNNDFFQLMAENSRDIIFRAHYLPTFGFDYVSQSSTRVTGYTPEEFYADPYLAKKCILPEDLHLLTDPTQPGAPPTYEPAVLRWRCKDGRMIWTEHTITITRNKHGAPETCQIIARDVTERKKAEEALQIEKNKLKSVIDAMTDDLTIQDRDYNIIFQNEPTRMSSGGDHVGQKCYRVYENREDLCEGCPLELAFKDGKPHTSERRRVLRSGEITFWEVTANPIIDAGGKAMSCLEIGRNITERKKQEQALANEMTRRRILIEQSSDGIVILDQNGAVCEANRRFAEMLGYSPEEILKLNVWDWEFLYPPEQVREMIKTIDEAGDHFKTQHRRKDGTIYDVEISTNGTMFAGQKLIFCVCRDVTERKKTEEALLESQKFVTSLLENAPHATVVINPDTSIRYVNPAWERLNGWTLSEAVGMKVPYPWWPQEFKEAFAEGFKEAMKQVSGKGEVIAVKKNGERYWIDMNWASVTNNGELQYLLINSVDITERKIAEEKRQAILKTALDGFWICSLEGKFLEVNDSYCKMTGYTQEELLKMSIQDVEAVQKPEQISQHIKKIVVEGGDRFETQHKCKDGRVIDIEISSKYPNTGEGQLFVFVRDITEHKKVEQALKESEEKFSVAFRYSPEMIVITDVENNKYLEINDSYTNVTGYSREELMSHNVDEFQKIWVKPEELKKMTSLLQTQGKARNEEFSFRMKSGEIRQWLSSADIVTIGGKQCMLAIATDITERKKMEEALRESEERFRSIVENSQAGIMILNDAYRITYANDELCRISGHSPLEIIGQDFRQFLDEESKQLVADRYVRRQREEEVPPRYEFNIIRKDGQKRHVEISSSVIKDLAGKIKTVAQILDITERKKVEEALRESEEKFSIAFKSSPNAVCIVTAEDAKFIEINESFIRFSGYSREEIIGHTPIELGLWVNDDDFKTTTIKMQETHHLDNEEVKSRMKSGEIRTGLFSAETIVIGGKKCMVLVITDITEQEKAKEALKESEEKFSAAFHSSPDMMILTNLRDGKYTEVNESFSQVLGYSREELIGHRAEEFNMWENPEEADKMTRLMQAQGNIRQEEYRFRTKSGEIRIWLCSADIITIGGQPSMLAVATDITDRKKALEALRESEEKFSKAFNASPGSISISRLKDGKFIEVNESFLRDKGYTREEIMGHSSSEFTIWATPEDSQRIMKILKSGGSVLNEVTQFRTKSGFIRTGLVSAEIINIGNEPCMLVLNNDITQQKQAEEQLRMLSSVTQQVSDSIIITDPKMRITYMNRAAQDLFGYTIDEAKGKNVAIFNKTPPTEKFKREIQATITSGKVCSVTIPKKRKDGSTIICDCRISPLYDEKGQISSFIDVQRDVTEQKEVDAQLQAQKQLIEGILATMPEGVLVIDGNDRVILANESVHEIFRRGNNALKNKLLKNIIPVDPLLNLYNSVKSGKKEDNTLEFRYRQHNIDNIIDCVAIKMDEERTLLTFSDVSREREEEEKLYLTDRLASIGEMAAGLAHELNNPLTGILSLSQLLMESDIPAEPKEDLQCINSEAKRAASIVKNVLLFTRNNNYENGQASVNEVVKDVLRLREYEEKANNISVVTNLQENLPDIPIDRFQLQQVFLNIILNAEAAIKEANRNGLLTVTTEKVNHHVNIMFSDNGCGIKKHVLPRIFDPFFTTKDIGKGTGLGLSICYGIVSKHGGKIGVKTQVNKGTTFTVRIPAVS